MGSVKENSILKLIDFDTLVRKILNLNLFDFKYIPVNNDMYTVFFSM